MELSDLDERNAIEEEFGPQRPGGGGRAPAGYTPAKWGTRPEGGQ